MTTWNEKLFITETTIMLIKKLAFIQDLPSSNFSRENELPDRGFIWFSSVPPGRFHNTVYWKHLCCVKTTDVYYYITTE
jgi:hypothetical protein